MLIGLCVRYHLCAGNQRINVKLNQAFKVKLLKRFVFLQFLRLQHLGLYFSIRLKLKQNNRNVRKITTIKQRFTQKIKFFD